MTRRELVRVPPPPASPGSWLLGQQGFGVVFQSGLEYLALGKTWSDHRNRKYAFDWTAEAGQRAILDELARVMAHGLPGLPGPYGGIGWVRTAEGEVLFFELSHVDRDDEPEKLPDAIGKVVPLEAGRAKRRKVA